MNCWPETLNEAASALLAMETPTIAVAAMLGTITRAKRFQRVLPWVWDMRVLLLDVHLRLPGGASRVNGGLGWERATSSVAESAVATRAIPPSDNQ
nr:hypothetical protein KPHV_54550 [Kitasatospora purpeofusca]